MSPVRRCKTWFGGVVPIMEQEKGRRPGHAPEPHYAHFEGLEGRNPSAECNKFRALPAQSLQRHGGRCLHQSARVFTSPVY